MLGSLSRIIKQSADIIRFESEVPADDPDYLTKAKYEMKYKLVFTIQFFVFPSFLLNVMHNNSTLHDEKPVSAIPLTLAPNRSQWWDHELDSESDTVYTHFGSLRAIHYQSMTFHEIQACATYNPLGPTQVGLSGLSNMGSKIIQYLPTGWFIFFMIYNYFFQVFTQQFLTACDEIECFFG